MDRLDRRKCADNHRRRIGRGFQIHDRIGKLVGIGRLCTKLVLPISMASTSHVNVLSAQMDGK